MFITSPLSSYGEIVKSGETWNNDSIASNYSNLPRKSIIYGSYFAFAILSFPHLPKCMPKQEFFSPLLMIVLYHIFCTFQVFLKNS